MYICYVFISINVKGFLNIGFKNLLISYFLFIFYLPIKVYPSFYDDYPEFDPCNIAAKKLETIRDEQLTRRRGWSEEKIQELYAEYYEEIDRHHCVLRSLSDIIKFFK